MVLQAHLKKHIITLGVWFLMYPPRPLPRPGALFPDFYWTQVYLGSDLWVEFVTHSLSKRGFANLTDMTLADQPTNSIETDNTNMAIKGNVTMQVTQQTNKQTNKTNKHINKQTNR